MLVVKRLVKSLMEYVETGKFPVKAGVLRDSEGNPILDFTSLEDESADGPEGSRTWAKKLLLYCSQGRMDLVDESINSMGQIGCSLFSYPNGTAVLTPWVLSDRDIPFAIMALARTTQADDKSGDSLAHRIAQCEQCEKFFIRKTIKTSRFHDRHCRIKHMNNERLRSGWFRTYYANKKKKTAS